MSKSERSYNHLINCIINSNWEKGISAFLDSFPNEINNNFLKLFRSRFTNNKLFLDLSRRNILIVDSDLGVIADSFFSNFKTVFYLNSGFKKALLSKRRNFNNYNNLKCIVSNFVNSLPFKDSSIDIVFIYNFHRFLLKGSQNNINSEKILKEIHRILSPDGLLFFNYSGKHFFSFVRKRPELLATKYFKHIDTIFYCGDPDNPTEAFLKNSFNIPFKKRFKSFHSGRGIIAGKSSFINSTLSKIIKHISNSLNSDFNFEKILFQSSTIVFLHCNDINRKGLILRIPYDQDSIKRCETNFNALKFIEKNLKFDNIKCPSPVLNGEIDGINFFAETRIEGSGYDHKSHFYDKITNECLNLSINVFNGSKFDIDINISNFTEYISSLFVIFESKYINKNDSRVTCLKDFLFSAFESKTLTGCVCHGDFKAENVLVDSKYSPTGIIDWDLFQPFGFPLSDLLHLLSRRAFLNRKFSAIDYINKILLPKKIDFFENKCIDFYIDNTNTNRQLLYPAIILYWLHHVSNRMGFHLIKNNAIWYRKYIFDSLDIAVTHITKK